MYKHNKEAPWLSIIIPCFNCSKTIEKVLNSIEIQDDSDIEIIICDDWSTDNFMKKVELYKDKFNIIYHKTKQRKIHCPGNTRLDALQYASGEWLVFIDDDDVFEPNAFKNVKELIEKRDEKYLVFTSLGYADINTDKIHCIFDNDYTLLHGKFYNRQYIIDNNINFKENLYICEDLYFNKYAITTLSVKGIDYTKENIVTYRQYSNPNSFTRSYNAKNKHQISEVYFSDFVTAATEPLFDILHKFNFQNAKIIYDDLAKTIFYMYCCIQSYKYSLGDEYIRKNEIIIKNCIQRICKEFIITPNDLINYIYLDPVLYDNIKHTAEKSTCEFIELESYIKFIQKIFLLY